MGKIIKKIKQELSYKNGRYYFPPDFLSLIITMKCNFRCQSCSIWETEFDSEIDDESWFKILEQIKKVLRPDTFIEINGGEPLLKKELILKLIPKIKKHFRSATLNSNGSLITREVVKELEAAGLDKIKISLYSLNPKTHNSLRGNDIAFNNAVNAIELLQKSGIKLEVGILLTAKNIKEIPELIRSFYGSKNVILILQILDEKIESQEAKTGKETKILEELWPKSEDVLSFFDWLENNNEAKKLFHPRTNFELIQNYYLNPKAALKYRCFAGQHNLAIYPNGDVALCFKGGRVGNLNQDSLEEILKIGAIGERLKIKRCQKYCRLVGCNFSRGFREIFRGL